MVLKVYDQKNYLFLFLLFLSFFHSSSYVFGACSNSCTNNASTWGNKRCLGNWIQYCDDGIWTNGTNCAYGCSNCECNSPPATATPFHCQYSDSQQRCVGYCNSGYTCTQIGTSDACICKLPPTNTPTPPSCSNTGGFCNNTTTCCKTTDVCFGNTCVDECDCVRGGNYCVNYCVSPGHADIWCYAAKDCANLCGNILYNEWVGYLYCPQAGDESCHPVTCHNAPDPEYCVTPTFNNLTIRRSDWFYTDRNDGLLLDNPET